MFFKQELRARGEIAIEPDLAGLQRLIAAAQSTQIRRNTEHYPRPPLQTASTSGCRMRANRSMARGTDLTASQSVELAWMTTAKELPEKSAQQRAVRRLFKCLDLVRPTDVSVGRS